METRLSNFCPPFCPKGQPVRLPLGQDADIVYSPNPTGSSTNQTVFRKQNGDLVEVPTEYFDTKFGNQWGLRGMKNDFPIGFTDQLNVDNSKLLKADLTDATSATISDLRKAFKLQEWLEKNARAGSRYVEFLLAHFGVRSSDARLQRPEYIGGAMSQL